MSPTAKPNARSAAKVPNDAPPSAHVAQSLLDLISTIPSSKERAHAEPDERADAIVRAAKSKAAVASAGLALPPGPVGWLTILPEIYAVWRIQAQMVSDLAAVHGRKSQLTREQMLFCLFRHTSAQLLRDVVMRIGERYVIRRLPLRSLYAVANKIGIRITQRSIGRAISRVVPVAGALGVGAYSWWDTRQVAKTAVKLFRSDIENVDEPTPIRASSASKEVPARRASMDAPRSAAKKAPRKVAATSPRKVAAKAPRKPAAKSAQRKRAVRRKSETG